MKAEIKNTLIVVALTALFSFIMIPKKSRKENNKEGFVMPDEAKETDNEYANAVISIKAYRAALNDNAPSNILNELKQELLKKYNIRISVTEKKLIIATTRSGKEIARENG